METYTRGNVTTNFFDSEAEFEHHQSQSEEISAMLTLEAGPAEEDEIDQDDDGQHLTTNQDAEVASMLWVVNHNDQKSKPKKDDGAGRK